VQYGDRLCRLIDLIEDPVPAYANAQQVSATIRERAGRARIIGETVGGIENSSYPSGSSARNPDTAGIARSVHVTE